MNTADCLKIANYTLLPDGVAIALVFIVLAMLALSFLSGLAIANDKRNRP